MNKIFAVLIIMFFIPSCKAQQYGNQPLDLNALNFNLNSEKFYSASMNRENIKLSSGKQYVERDTLNEYGLDSGGNRDLGRQNYYRH